MGMTPLITLAGVLNYYPTLFDNMQLPVPPTDAAAIGLQADQLRAAWTISKEDFSEFMALHSMGMCLAYPDADFMKYAIGVWSKAHIHEWQRMFDTLFFRYNPLWNKDGKITETGTDTHTGHDVENIDGTAAGNSTNTGYTHGYDGGTTHTDDGLSWSHADKTVSSNQLANGTDRDYTTNNTDTLNHVTVEQGNIGVTKTTELIKEERELALFSIEEYIADEFKKQFCLMIW